MELLFPLHPILQILFPVSQLCKLETSVLSLHACLLLPISNPTRAPGDYKTNMQPTLHSQYLHSGPHCPLPEPPQQPPRGSPHMWSISTCPPVIFLKLINHVPVQISCKGLTTSILTLFQHPFFIHILHPIPQVSTHPSPPFVKLES